MGFSCFFGHKWNGNKCTKCGKKREKNKPHPTAPKIISNEDLDQSQKLNENMVFVEGRSFTMGDTTGGGPYSEKPTHQVTLSSFYVSKYQVTQKQWHEVMDNNPSYFKGDNLPVETVSWHDCVEFCNKLSQIEGLTPCYSGCGENIACDWSANGFRLPTEAEWEFAAKGGNKSKGYTYAGSNDLGSVAWFADNSSSTTHQVGQKQANELGLYDMSGNVWEWCWDWYSLNCDRKRTVSDPKGADAGLCRLLRGGSWYTVALSCRVSYCDSGSPDYGGTIFGFRLFRSK